MTKFTSHRSFAATLALVLLACLAVDAAPPKVDSLFPAGAKRGTTVTITAVGEFSSWPPRIVCNRADVTITSEKDKGKFVVTVADNAEPGIAWLRFCDDEGASSLRPFMIGTLPEVEEIEPNDAPQKAQSINGSTIINGRLAAKGDVDGFTIELQRDQRFTAAVQANAILGSPLDSILQICELVPREGFATGPDSAEAFVLEQNHDSVGLDSSATIVAPRDGRYLVRIFAFPATPNSSIGFASGENFIYRLTMTTDDYDPASVLPPVASLHPVSSSDAAAVALPATFVGSFTTSEADHAYRFTANKRQKLTFVAQTSAIGHPTELSWRIVDAKGTTLVQGEGGDPKKELEFNFNSPAEAEYTLRIRELFGRSGPRFGYRITGLSASEFELTAAKDAYVLTADKPLEIPITIDRRFGCADAVEIRALDLPVGVTAEKVVSEPKGDGAKSVKLVLKSSPEAVAASVGFHLVGVSNGAMPITRPVRFSTGLPLDPSHDEFQLTIRK